MADRVDFHHFRFKLLSDPARPSRSLAASAHPTAPHRLGGEPGWARRGSPSAASEPEPARPICSRRARQAGSLCACDDSCSCSWFGCWDARVRRSLGPAQRPGAMLGATARGQILPRSLMRIWLASRTGTVSQSRFSRTASIPARARSTLTVSLRSPPPSPRQMLAPVRTTRTTAAT